MTSKDAIVAAFDRLAASRRGDVMIASPSKRATFGDVDGLSRAIDVPSHLSGMLVGLAAPNCIGFFAAFLALRRAGATVLLLDSYSPPEARARAASAMGAASILVWDGVTAAPTFVPITTPEGRGACADGIQPVVVKLTSGSTGKPRGVAMTANALLADEDGLARSMGFRDGDRIAASVPLSHSYGFTTVALSALVRGLTVILPSREGPFDSLDAAHQLRATIFPTVPSYIGALLKMAEPPRWADSIRTVISAGAPLPPADAARFREIYGTGIHVFYGSSECGGISYDREGTAAERGTVGSPVEGVRVTIAPEPEGIVTVESDAVGSSYVPDADLRLQPGRFQTNDLATWRNGEIALLRRVDDVIQVRGHKVDPSEVERVLAGLDGVEEVVVVGVPTRDQREQIVRAVVACSSRSLDYQDVAMWCRARLADHKVPRSVVIVDEIPRTSRGKIDRNALLSLGGASNG